MKILVLGGAGMLGHKTYQTLARRFPDTWCTVRSAASLPPASEPILSGERVLSGVDVSDIAAVERLLGDFRFDVVVNCTGVIKQRSAASEAIPSITVNSLLPHRLAATLQNWGGRLIHFSTDCVFSGLRGDYTEDDQSDAQDLYGKSKFLGEVVTPNALTLRTSIIGRELQHHSSLLDWFLAQNGKTIQGYRRAWWSGVTTNHLADLVADLLEQQPRLHGLFQVSSGKLSKFDLLIMLRDRYALNIDIVPDDTVFCDRSLSGRRLATRIGYVCPTWSSLIDQLLIDTTTYPGTI